MRVLHRCVTSSCALLFCACILSAQDGAAVYKKNCALCRYFPEPLPPSAGAFSRDEPHITGQRLAIYEPPRITQAYFRGQRRNWPTPGWVMSSRDLQRCSACSATC